jgi:predicted translin family RNA/ssDNA-binding protein
MEQFEIVLFSVALVFFSGWFMYLTNRLRGALLSLEDSDDAIDEIRESVEVVAQILQRLPEMMPSFGINQSPLQPLIEAFASKFMGAEPIKAVEAGRGPDGQFNGETTQE